MTMFVRVMMVCVSAVRCPRFDACHHPVVGGRVGTGEAGNACCGASGAEAPTQITNLGDAGDLPGGAPSKRPVSDTTGRTGVPGWSSSEAKGLEALRSEVLIHRDSDATTRRLHCDPSCV